MYLKPSCLQPGTLWLSKGSPPEPIVGNRSQVNGSHYRSGPKTLLFPSRHLPTALQGNYHENCSGLALKAQGPRPGPGARFCSHLPNSPETLGLPWLRGHGAAVGINPTSKLLMSRTGKGLTIAGRYTNHLISGNDSLGHSNAHFPQTGRLTGKASPQASTQETLWLLAAAAAVAAAPLV